MDKDNMTWEWCPHCNSEVELKCEIEKECIKLNND